MTSITRPIKIALSALMVLSLVACGKILEWDNANVKGGKIYEGRANEPFSGKVTNIPMGVITQSQPGYWAMTERASKIHQKVVFRQALCVVKVSDGVLDGDAICEDSRTNGAILEGRFNDGNLDGKFVIRDHQTKFVLVEAQFKSGQLDGAFKLWNIETQQMAEESHYVRSVLNGKYIQFDKSGLAVGQGSYLDGKLHGPYEYRGDDQTKVGTYNEGVFTGAITKSYWLEGQINKPGFLIGPLTMQVSGAGEGYELGRQHSLVQNVEYCARKDTHAVHGEVPSGDPRTIPFLEQCKARFGLATQPQAPAASTSTAATAKEDRSDWPDEENDCTKAWAQAFRKANGEEAPIRHDMAWEYVDNCRAGKRP